ncbi:MAG TPA: hypothetical protein VI386_31035 [Candidatus Sulfotelmatobacter sp.]
MKKLHHFERDGKWGVAWGCAGDSDAIRKFYDNLVLVLSNEKDEPSPDLPRLQRAQQIIESIGKDIHDNYERANLEIVAGVWSFVPLEFTLCHMDVKHGNCLSTHDDYACGGMDLSLGKFALESLHHTSLTIGESIGLGIFTTHLMKDTAEGVGGPIQLMTWRMANSFWSDYEQHTIDSIEVKYRTEDMAQLIKRYWSEHNPSWLPPL